LGLLRVSQLDELRTLEIKSWLGDRRNKTVTFAGNGLDEPRVFWIVLEHLPDLADGAIDAVIGVKKNSLAPDPLDNFLPADQIAPLLD